MLDLKRVFAGAEISISMALGFVRVLVEPKEQWQLAVEACLRLGHRLDDGDVRQIVQYAKDLSRDDSEQAGRLLQTLPEDGTPATAWLRAVLLENNKRYSDAADALRTLTDAGSQELRAFRLLSCARNLMKTEKWEESWVVLREAISVTESYQTLCAADNLLGRLLKHDRVAWKRRCRIGLIGNTTLDFLVPAVRAKCAAAGIAAEVYCGAFGQYYQEIVDQDSGLGRLSPDVVIIATDWRALSIPDEVAFAETFVESQMSALRDLWRRCRDRWGAFVFQHNFDIPLADPYGRLSAALNGGRGRILRQINLRLWEAAGEEAGVVIVDVDQIAAVCGKAAWNDPAMWHVAKQHFAAAAIPHLAHHYMGLLRAVYGLSAKCLVLDLDNTLWGGVIGEDGVIGIELGGTPTGEAFLEFQRYIKSLRQRGIILAVCSKNDEIEAKRPFLEHPEMILSLDDFAMFVANWQSKDENLRLIADTLNIGIDSLVFVDDNPAERAWIRQQMPDVALPEMPIDPALFIGTLEQGKYFESLSLTEEDRRRTDTYRENVQRSIFKTATQSMDEFLLGLQMQVELLPFNDANSPRIAQLINKTNQFNLTTRRMSETRIFNLMNQPGCYTQSLRLRDRFGDNGLAGVLIAFVEGESIRIDTWLMSCRILGRRIEDVMLNAVMHYARREGLKEVIGEYISSSKNGQVRDLYDRLGFEHIDGTADGVCRYRWELSRIFRDLPPWFRINDRTQKVQECILPVE